MKQNYTLGRGKVFFDPFASGTMNLTGEDYFGNTPEFTFNISSETLDHYSSDEGVNELDDQALLQITRSGSFMTDHISPENIARFFLGEASTVTEAGDTALTWEVSGVKQGRYYQIGTSAASPSGVRKITNVSIADDQATPTTFVEGTDYTIDLALGRFQVVEGGGIADDTNLVVTYDTEASTRDQIVTASDAEIEGAMRFISYNAAGEQRDYYAPYVKITPNGDFSLKGDQWQQISFNVQFLKKDETTQALYIDGRAA